MKQVNFRPVNDLVLIEAKVIDEKTPGGVMKSQKMIEEEKAKLDMWLTVAAVSDTVTEVEPGDMVMIRPNQYTSIVLEGITYLLVNKISIYGKKLSTMQDVYTKTQTDSISKPSEK